MFYERVIHLEVPARGFGVVQCANRIHARCFGGGCVSALINDVLDLSKIEAGKMELESVAFNLRKEVDSVFTLFDEKLQQKKLEVFMLVHEAVPTCVVGDPGRFRQVLDKFLGFL